MSKGKTGKPWTDEEVAATVEKYFELLGMEKGGQTFNKSAAYRELSTRYASRTVKSFARKMCNISAVLSSEGLPYLRGLSPLGNYQRSLTTFVKAELERSSLFD